MNETFNIDDSDIIEHKVIFAGRPYERIYVPVFLKYNKAQLPHYNFIKTISAGDTNGHIIQGGNYYFMCLSRDDNISAEEKTMEPMGYRRRSIDELQSLADVFCAAYASETTRGYNSINRRHPKAVVPPVLNMRLEWHERMKNHYIINVSTKQQFHLAESKTQVAAQCKLTIHLLNVIIRDGSMAKNWCYKGQRLDGLTWEQYFDSVKNAAQVCQQTP